MNKEFEALDKLEECAEGMKDLPKSNWIDLAENEAELDEKIFSWVEEIKFELFKGKQALTELKAIKEAKPSEAIECLERIENNILYLLSDCDVDVETDTNFLSLKEHKSCEKIRNYILKAQEQEKVLEILKPLCEVVETPVRKDRYLKINGVVVYTFKTQEEFDLLKRWREK